MNLGKSLSLWKSNIPKQPTFRIGTKTKVTVSYISCPSSSYISDALHLSPTCLGNIPYPRTCWQQPPRLPLISLFSSSTYSIIQVSLALTPIATVVVQFSFSLALSPWLGASAHNGRHQGLLKTQIWLCQPPVSNSSMAPNCPKANHDSSWEYTRVLLASPYLLNQPQF